MRSKKRRNLKNPFSAPQKTQAFQKKKHSDFFLPLNAVEDEAPEDAVEPEASEDEAVAPVEPEVASEEGANCGKVGWCWGLAEQQKHVVIDEL